jgi:hypothetical protein
VFEFEFVFEGDWWERARSGTGWRLPSAMGDSSAGRQHGCPPGRMAATPFASEAANGSMISETRLHFHPLDRRAWQARPRAVPRRGGTGGVRRSGWGSSLWGRSIVCLCSLRSVWQGLWWESRDLARVRFRIRSCLLGGLALVCQVRHRRQPLRAGCPPVSLAELAHQAIDIAWPRPPVLGDGTGVNFRDVP